MQKATKLVGVILGLLTIASLFGQGIAPIDSDGDGKLEINNKKNLLYLSTHSSYWGYNFEQTADIIFEASDFASGGNFYNGGDGFQPIGNGTTHFTGSYNGQGHIIHNLFIGGSGTYVGFFGRTDGAEIRNLGFEDADVTGYCCLGVLIGLCDSTKIINCYSTGIIESELEVGGLIGDLKNGSFAKNCFSSVDITVNVFCGGGLVGLNYNSSLQECFCIGNVQGNNYLGGFVGMCGLNSSFMNCFCRGDVYANDYAGGFIGVFDGGSVINYCYSTGFVNGSSTRIGGLIGSSSSSTVLNSFWNINTSGQTTSRGGTGMTTAEMKNLKTYTDTRTAGLSNAWDFFNNPYDDVANSNLWIITQGYNDGYPRFCWQNKPVPVSPFSLIAVLALVGFGMMLMKK